MAITDLDLYVADTDVGALPSGDDKSSPLITLSPPFRFFGASYTDIYVRGDLEWLALASALWWCNFSHGLALCMCIVKGSDNYWCNRPMKAGPCSPIFLYIKSKGLFQRFEHVRGSIYIIVRH